MATKNLIAVLFLVATAGCASQPVSTVEPQSVTIHFLDDSEWFEHTNELMLSGKSWAMPYDIRGSADWESDPCVIYLPSGKPPPEYADTLAHELRHCSEGGFHR